jgi:hypothetical protein
MSSISSKNTVKKAATGGTGESASAADVPHGKMPGETVRALISLWLLFHLLGVALALSNNPTYERQSRLISAIKSTPGVDQYLHGLWLDVPYSYRFTWGQLQDADHAIEIDVIDADGNKLETRQLPPAGAHGEQAERLEALARQVSMPLYNEGNPSIFAEKIGGAILAETGAKEVKFRIRRHSPLSMDDVKGSDPAQRDPENARTKTDIYEASVTLNSLGEPQVQQKLSALDAAPVTRPSAKPNNSSPPAGKHNQAAPLPKPPLPGERNQPGSALKDILAPEPPK